MVTAIRKVHAPNGRWVTDGGFEYNVVLLAALAGVTSTGPGSPSADALLARASCSFPEPSHQLSPLLEPCSVSGRRA